MNRAAPQYVALFTDITALKEYEQKLERSAHYDALTNLPTASCWPTGCSRAWFRPEARSTISGGFLDLDGFKAINDKHGHEAATTC